MDVEGLPKVEWAGGYLWGGRSTEQVCPFCSRLTHQMSSHGECVCEVVHLHGFP